MKYLLIGYKCVTGATMSSFVSHFFAASSKLPEEKQYILFLLFVDVNNGKSCYDYENYFNIHGSHSRSATSST